MLACDKQLPPQMLKAMKTRRDLESPEEENLLAASSFREDLDDCKVFIVLEKQKSDHPSSFSHLEKGSGKSHPVCTKALACSLSYFIAFVVRRRDSFSPIFSFYLTEVRLYFCAVHRNVEIRSFTFTFVGLQQFFKLLHKYYCNRRNRH